MQYPHTFLEKGEIKHDVNGCGGWFRVWKPLTLLNINYKVLTGIKMESEARIADKMMDEIE